MEPWMQPYAACAALAAAQLAVTLRFGRLLLRGPAPRGASPPAAVIVACKGELPQAERNVPALLAQDYAGPVEFLFVVPSEDDPAHARLKPLLGARGRLLVSGRAPERCSGKNADLLFALERASPSAELLVFADADLCVGPDWLRELAAPLAEPGVGAATAAMLYLPPGLGLWSLLRMAWMGAGIPYLELTGIVTGQSAAVRRADFERLGVAELWSRSLMDDLSLSARLKDAGLGVRHVPRAMGWSPETCDARGLLAQTNRWIAAFRVYAPGVWALGLLTTAAKLWLAWLGLVRPPLLAALLAGDAANLVLLFLLYGRALGRRAPLRAALAAPLLQAVYAVNFLSSLWPRVVTWGGVRYRVRGPQDVTVLRS